MFKKYRNKESGEECFIKMETETFLKVFFPDNIGEEGGDSEQTKIMNRNKFLEQYEPIE